MLRIDIQWYPKSIFLQNFEYLPISQVLRKGIVPKFLFCGFLVFRLKVDGFIGLAGAIENMGMNGRSRNPTAIDTPLFLFPQHSQLLHVHHVNRCKESMAPNTMVHSGGGWIGLLIKALFTHQNGSPFSIDHIA